MKRVVQPHIVFTFERGGGFTAKLFTDLAPTTVAYVLELLPLEATAYHTRWCGREVYIPIKENKKPVPPENQTIQTNTGDVVFWQEWGKGKKTLQTISVYYGPELVRDHRGFLPVNVFGRVPQNQWRNIETIGLRIWQQGIERVRIDIKGKPL